MDLIAAHRRTRSAFIAAASFALIGMLAAPASADDRRLPDQASPAAASDSIAAVHYRQYTGERILGLSAAPTCSVVMTKNYPMANTEEGPDKPFEGTFQPGSCTGTYTRIVAHVHTNITGVQSYRVGWVNLGGARIVTLTTQVPHGDGMGEVVQDETYDVTRYSSLFTPGSPVEFDIANQLVGRYDGIFYADLAFEFYADAVPLPDPAPDVVAGLPASTLLADPVTQEFTIPANTTTLSDELYVKPSGECDEYWWAAAPAGYPGQCVGYPILEIDVSIDGQAAALVNTYPVVFAGTNGPTWWEPIPGPRAYDLRPYTVDLSPFIGALTDGLSHTITYTIPKRSWTEGNDVTVWSNLLIATNPDSDGRTTGAITEILPGSVEIHDHGDAQSYYMNWSHSVDVYGTVQPAGGTAEALHNSFIVLAKTKGAESNDNVYHWTTSVGTVDRSREVQDYTMYHIVSRADGWYLQDNRHDFVIRDGGMLVGQVRLRDWMHSDTDPKAPSDRRSTEHWNLTTTGPLGCGATHLAGEYPSIVRYNEFVVHHLICTVEKPTS